MNLRRPSPIPPAALAAAILVFAATGGGGAAVTPSAPDASSDGAATGAAPSEGAPAPAAAGEDAATPPRVDMPQDLHPYFIDGRKQVQLATKGSSTVDRDFQFTNHLADTGITFVSHETDDSAKTYKPVHYDHGTALAVADVDGDGLTDLYFVRQVGPNELWRNVGGGKFVDFTAEAGVAVPDKIGSSAAFADIDNDGDPDLYTTSIRGGNVLFENDGKGHFTDVTAASGLAYTGHSGSPLFFDYDRDGRLDLLLCNIGVFTTDTLRTSAVNPPGETLAAGELQFYDGFEDAFGGHLKPERTERSLLFHNEGGMTFADTTDATGLVDDGWTGDATVLDGNEDGWPDVYVLNMQGNDGYWQNDGGKRFTNERESVFPKTPWGSMGVKSFDVDNDGHQDLYVTDMHSDMSAVADPLAEKRKSAMMWPDDYTATDGTSIWGNAFYHNLGGGKFEEVSDAIGAETFWPWGLSVGDLNADGFDDAFVAGGMGYPFRYGVNSLLINDGGKKLLDSEFILGIEPRINDEFAGPQFVLDCSGADKDHSDCVGREGKILVWGALSSRSSAIFDVDGDGDLDIVVSEINSPPLVLESDLAQVRPTTTHLNVRLKGTRSNRDGFGSKVTVVVGDRRIVQVYDGNTGYLSHGLLPMYFGLDGAAAADSVEVLWPSGETQTVAGPLEAGSTVAVEEPATAN
ncbi:MAG: CRTAC1 family protein [Ardenticatenales bacterium]